MLPGTPVKVERKPRETKEESDRVDKIINPACARLNLFPLIDQGRNEHPALYEIASKLLRLFYHPTFLQHPGMEYQLLDAMITAGKRILKEELILPIETLDLKDPFLQSIYYSLLKGTKKDPPPLLDYFKIERVPSTICLFDADPKMLSVFFGEKQATALYEEIHSGQKQSIELETLISQNPELAFTSPEVWKMIHFQRPKHGNHSRITLVSEDAETGISLRREIKLTN